MSLKLITVEYTVKTKVLGFRDNKFSYDTYQMIRPVTMFQEKTTDMKSKNSLNFPAVTLWALN
jgi:hypothetical protein